MLVPLSTDDHNPIVWPKELAALPERVRVGWAAFCVERAAALLSPDFRHGTHLNQVLELAWGYAAGRGVGSAAEVRNEILRICDANWNPTIAALPEDAWAAREGYELEHVTMGSSLLSALVEPARAPRSCHDAVEAASRAYGHRQLWVQGCRFCPDLPTYVDDRQLVFHSMARRAFEVAGRLSAAPTPGTFAGIELDMGYPPIPAKLLQKARRRFPVPPTEVRWLQETGQARRSSR